MNAKTLLGAVALWRFASMAWPQPVKSLENTSALVTGASGSLGEAIVNELVANGVTTLVLWDVQEKPLRELEAKLKAKHGAKLRVLGRVVNLVKRQQIYDEAKVALDFCNQAVDLVVNNAGIVKGGYVCDIADDMDQLTFEVNSLSHVWMTKAFLPAMERRGKGHFLNVSSMASFVATAGMVSYASSKYAARGWSEGLAHELRNRKSPVKVTCLCPSQFDSKLFAGFFVLGNLPMTAEYVAQQGVLGVRAERELVCVPKYLIPTIPIMGMWQANGFLNMRGDSSNPMANWKGGSHADTLFKDMGAKL